MKNQYGIKLIALDVDGTLFNSWGQITKDTQKALLAVQRNGIRVILNTGRLCGWIHDIAQNIGIDRHSKVVIGGNGSEIQNIVTNQYLFNSNLSPLLTAQLIKYLDQFPDLHYAILPGDDYNLCLWNNQRALDWFLSKAKTNLFENELINRKVMQEAKQIMLFAKDETLIGEITNYINALQVGVDVKVTGYGYWEVSYGNVNKWTAIETYCKYLKENEGVNITPEQIMTFGDQLNDYEMIANAKFGIAMGNADEELKRVAFMVCDDNNHDGIAKAIKKIIF